MLVAVALVTVVVLTDGDDGWVGYLTAALEAAMVGGLADWFAVTALFRHPLGVPVPHTAVIPERKDSFATTLGEFVQDHLLTQEVIVERVREARPTERAASWLAEPDNAARLAGHLVDAAESFADLLRDEDVHRALEDAVRSRIDSVPLAPLAGRALELLTDDERHQELLDVLLRAVDRFLRENRDILRRRFADGAPWWLPGAIENRVFERLIDGAHRVIHDVVRDPDHELRYDFDARLRRLADDLQTSAELRRRGEDLKHDLLTRPELRGWVAAAWSEVKATLRAHADDPDSPLRARLAEGIAAAGDRLRGDPALMDRADEAVEVAARYVSEQFHDEIAAMVSGAIARWDGQEAATHLELLLGPDLQYIRINGTVVGGAAGLALHTATQTLG
jgi:uncharacterized membrane-anchored protein YjiN (DUF445 family)